MDTFGDDGTTRQFREAKLTFALYGSTQSPHGSTAAARAYAEAGKRFRLWGLGS